MFFNKYLVYAKQAKNRQRVFCTQNPSNREEHETDEPRSESQPSNASGNVCFIYFFSLHHVMVLIILLKLFSVILQVRYYNYLLVKLQVLVRRKTEREVKRETTCQNVAEGN